MSVKVETLVLFGATGDLAQRMLFPSLYNLHLDGLLADALTIIGSGRSTMDRATFQSQVRAALAEHLPADRIEDAGVAAFLDRIDYCAIDAGAGTGLAEAAAGAGFADQAHFTREARHFHGAPPARLLSDPEAMAALLAPGL